MENTQNIAQLFKFVLLNYDNGFKKIEKSDPNNDVITKELPKTLKKLLPIDRKDLYIAGSCGKGQKTDYPWVAIYNTNITRSAMKGLYIVYLFKKDLGGVYLTLNQGITYFSETYKKEKYECARKVADYFKNEIGDEYFSKESIDLGGKKGTLGYGYAQTAILSAYYSLNDLSEDKLESDLLRMMDIYDELAGVLREDNYDYDKGIDKILFDYDKAFTPANEAIQEIKNEISSPLDADIVRELEEVVPKVKSVKKYSKLRNIDVIRKVNYIEKAKADAEIGELGEQLALEYEVRRLTDLGRPDLVGEVRRVSIKSDAFGYDIESVNVINGKAKKIFIEVKTTINKMDVDFQVSRNEVETSNEKKDSYCLFRIYDAKNVKPKFYKEFGKIEDHFELNPITYMARHK